MGEITTQISADQIAMIDRRSTPRIKAELDLTIEADILGRVIDISDTGIRFSSPEEKLPKKCSVALKVPSRSLELDLEIVWQSKNEATKENFFGARIVDSGQKSQEAIRKYIISSQFKAVVSNVKDKYLRSQILAFSKDFREYVFALNELSQKAKTNDDGQEYLHDFMKKITDQIVEKGEGFRQKIDNKLVYNRIKQAFRELVAPWAYKSRIVKRSFDKPKGYPGDYQTLEIIYNFETFSKKDDIGYYFDVYFLHNPYADAVRNRKNILREIIKNFLLQRSEPAKILNLASGSCREIRELFQEVGTSLPHNEVLFSCLDWDDDSLAFSKEKLKNLPANARFEFIKEDILNYAKTKTFFEQRGSYDLIYSIGLADYLPDRVNIKIMQSSFHGLKPGGKFVIAHKDREISFSHLPPEWFCDWVFIPRNEPEMIELIKKAELGEHKLEIERDTTRQIFFISIIKI